MTSSNTPPPWAITWLSAPRMAPYLAAGGDPLALYRWNSQLSAALFEVVGWFEVGWRNAIDTAICTRRPESAPHWLLDRFFPLTAGAWKHVDRALSALPHSDPNPGQIIAELTLGFWRFTSRGYMYTVWSPYLQHMFPHARKKPRPQAVNARLARIVSVRNRIAHHEPLLSRVAEVRGAYSDMLTLGEWINPAAASWWRDNATVETTLTDRP